MAIGLAVFPYDVGPTKREIKATPRTAELVEFTDTLADGSPCPSCPRMVALLGGSFVMGSPAGEVGLWHLGQDLQRQVDVPAFAMGMYEVSIAQYQEFIEFTQNHA